MDKPNLPCVPVAVLGSSLSRRTELVEKAWSIMKEESAFPITGMMVDPPPVLFDKVWLDCYIRDGATVYQEMGNARKMNLQLAESSELAAGFLFGVQTAIGFLVDRLLDRDDKRTQVTKRVLVGADGNPLNNEEQIEGMLAFNSFSMAQMVTASVYGGFFLGGYFMLGSDETAAQVVTESKDDVYPVGSIEQRRHYYYKQVSDNMQLPIIELDSDIDHAARTMADGLMYRFKLKEETGGKE